MSIREKKGFFGRLSEKIGDAIMGRATIDESLFDDLEEVLITGDIGLETTMKIIDSLKAGIYHKSEQGEKQAEKTHGGGR